MDMYDFGARYYDPTLATWHSIDPLAEGSPEWSPYNYVEDNPVNMMDPDGMQPSNATHIPFWGSEAGFGAGWNIAGTAGGAVAAGLSIPGLVNKFTPGFSSVQNFSGLGSVQGNGIGINVPQPGPQATLSQFHPNTFDKWKESGFLGKFTYDIADQAYVSIRSVFWPYGGVNHLNGEYASAKDKTLAFGYTAAMFIPMGRSSAVAKSVLENAAEHGVIETEAKELPIQIHHFATNKNRIFTPQMEAIVKKFNLDLNGPWNKEMLKHLGRHPNEYHEFVLRGMQDAADQAGGSQAKFLKLFDQYIKQPVMKNPGLLRKSGW